MKTPRPIVHLFTLMLGLFAAFSALQPVPAKADVSFSFFYDSLEPYGEWIQVEDYGYCWRPSGVDSDWSPYTDGYWAYTDAGWTWVSYEDFGGIVYHYGRWVNLEDEGWCWVPDYEWGPAWVSWRTSPTHVGWAPLPPAARFRHSIGISVWVDSTYDIGPGYYNFCEVRDFGAPVLRAVLLPRPRSVVLIEETVNVTNITYYNDVVYCGGPQYTFISERVVRPVPALKLVQNNTVVINNITNNVTINNGRTPARRASFAAVQKGNTLQVVAPVVTPPANVSEMKPAKVTKVVAKAKPTNGWAMVKDPAQKAAIKEKLQKETKGLTAETAPAKPVDVAEVKAVVPEKADLTAPAVKPGKPGKPVAGAADKPGKAGQTPGATIAPGEPAPGTEPEGKKGRGPTAEQPGTKPGKGRPNAVPEVSNPAVPGVDGQKETATKPSRTEQERAKAEERAQARAEAARQKEEEKAKRQESKHRQPGEVPQGQPGQPGSSADAAEQARAARAAREAAAKDAAAKDAAAREAARQAREQAAREESAARAEKIRQQREARAAQEAAESRRAQQENVRQQQLEQQQQQQQMREREMRQQQQAAERQQAAARAAQEAEARRAQIEARRAERSQPQPQPQIQQAPQGRPVPPQSGGRRPLTKEEAEALKRQDR